MNKQIFSIISEAVRSDNKEEITAVRECEISDMFEGIGQLDEDVDTKLTLNSVRIYTDGNGSFFIDLQELNKLSLDMEMDLIECLNAIIKNYEDTGIGADNFKVILDSPEGYDIMAKAAAADSDVASAFNSIKSTILTLKSNGVGMLHK